MRGCYGKRLTGVMSRILFACSLMLSVLVFAVNAQQSSGVYTTYVADKAIVVDHYTVTSSPDGTIRTEARLSPPGGAAQTATTVAINHRPRSFALEAGEAKRLEAVFGRDSVSLSVAGAAPRTLPTKATMVLENLLWHQFVFLLDQYDETKGGRQDFTAFLPSQALDYPISVERTGTPAYNVNGQQFSTRRYHLVANGQLALEMWTDTSRAPLVFYGASQKLKVVREGSEALADAVLAAIPKPAEYHPPPYARPGAFSDQQVIIGEGSQWALHGILTLPAGTGPFPAVVLVHGSGPNDQDETIGPNKPFRDLALGLASEGIAVLRYNKRTFERSRESVAINSRFTLKEEAIDDALAAVALLQSNKQIDPRRIYVLGHSLGGVAAPRIAAAEPRIAGLVIMAGPTGPLEDAIVRQYEYAAMLDGKITPAEQAEIDRIKAQVACVKALTPSSTTPASELPFGIAPAYWLDLRKYDPLTVAAHISQPMLVLQGERDYQVTLADFEGWKPLSATKRVELKSYPKLNHLFLEGEGKSSGAEYMQPGNIPKYVIDDIAAWIRSQP